MKWKVLTSSEVRGLYDDYDKDRTVFVINVTKRDSFGCLFGKPISNLYFDEMNYLKNSENSIFIEIIDEEEQE